MLDHGAGGRAAHELVVDLFLRHLGHPGTLEDSAVLDFPPGGRLAMTTDSYVVTPLFFPGGNIGELAVFGTVNDLAMRGAQPLYLTAGFILEEGLDLEVLDLIVAAMAEAALRAKVKIVAGDTKVVPRGAADQCFINTAGVGLVPAEINIASHLAQPGDVVIINGTIADHGLAVLCQREGLTLETPIKSDTAPLADLVASMLAVGGPGVHVLRDPTRGGVGTTLNELAASSGIGIIIEENCLPVSPVVRGACDILGLDPLYVANEGKLLALVAESADDTVLAAMKAHPLGREAVVIGRVTADHPGRVLLHTIVGGRRIVDMLTGEQLPRIC